MNILRCIRCVLICIYKVGFISRTIWTDHQENSQLVKVIILRSDRIITMFIKLTSDWKVIIWRWIREKPFFKLQLTKRFRNVCWKPVIPQTCQIEVFFCLKSKVKSKNQSDVSDPVRQFVSFPFRFNCITITFPFSPKFSFPN